MIDVVVAVIAGGVGEADQVEPEDRHPLAEMGRGQQPVDQPLVGVGAVVADERVDLLGRRGQADQVEAEAADQGRPVGLGRRLEPFGRQPGADEPVDRRRRAAGWAAGSAGRVGGMIGPVPLPLGPLARSSVG